MPNVLLEAWTRGVPALVLIHDPGRVVETHRLGAFAGSSRERFTELARDLWNGRRDRQAVAERCRRYIQAVHAPDRIASQWVEVLSGVRPTGTLPAITEAETRCAA